MRGTEVGSAKRWSLFDSWVGRVGAVLGLIATLAGAVTWWINRDRERAERRVEMSLAASQALQGDYAASLNTYSDILKTDPLDPSPLDGELHAAMLWTENFSVSVPDGANPADVAGPQLDRILTTLESGLTRSQGSRAADLQAHLGWAHWLNQHIASREFGSAPETNFQAALKTDPQNVYAHAMLGNWLLQTGGDESTAVQHLHAAVAAGRARPFVRQLQVGGLLSRDDTGSRAELFRVANQMRTGNETLASDFRRRVADFCCSPTLTTHAEFTASLSAVDPDAAWQTYVWLDDAPGGSRDPTVQALTRSFVQGSLFEIAGKREEALVQFRRLQTQLTRQPGSLRDAVNAAVVRLQRSS